jgi:hypothetical protein
MADTFRTGTCSSTITRTKNYGTLAKKVACRMLSRHLWAFLSLCLFIVGNFGNFGPERNFGSFSAIYGG